MIHHAFHSSMILLVLLHCTLFVIVGCASNPSASRIVYKDPNRVVRLEVIYRPEGKEHSHPATLSSRDMATVLKDLSVTPRPTASQHGPFAYGKKPKTLDSSQIFPDNTLDFLCLNLAKALHRATPSEDVLFSLIQPGSEGTSEITSGSLFVEGKQLHLLFANYRHLTVGTSEIAKARDNPLEVLGQPLYDITPGPFGKIQVSRGVVAFLSGTPQHLAIEYPSLLKTHGSVKDGNRSSSQATASPDQSISEKLKELHNLRDNNLITEEEFQKLRTKLLSSF